MSLLTVRTAARELGVAYSTLKRWIRTGRVRTTLTEGGHHRVARDEVDRLLTRQEPESRPAARRAKAREQVDEPLLISARNRLPGFVEEVRVDGLLAQVRLRVGVSTLTAVITADAARTLKLKRGDDAIALVKSTEVMIARAAKIPAAPRSTRPRR